MQPFIWSSVNSLGKFSKFSIVWEQTSSTDFEEQEVEVIATNRDNEITLNIFT